MMRATQEPPAAHATALAQVEAWVQAIARALAEASGLACVGARVWAWEGEAQLARGDLLACQE